MGQKDKSYKLQPLAELHFVDDHGDNGLRATLYSLSGLAIFILMIASINFINLSTAQSARRAREIGIRKGGGQFEASDRCSVLVGNIGARRYLFVPEYRVGATVVMAFLRLRSRGCYFRSVGN